MKFLIIDLIYNHAENQFMYKKNTLYKKQMEFYFLTAPVYFWKKLYIMIDRVKQNFSVFFFYLH